MHLWYVLYDAIEDAELLAAYRELLTADESARLERFVFERHRRQFLITRALQRSVLSQYAAVDPKDWRFASNEYGKPAICGPRGVPLAFVQSVQHRGSRRPVR